MYPNGSLILSGSTLYGMAYQGGANNDGTIFSYNTSTSTFTTLHSFAGTSDGMYPNGSLILSGSTLYGMASQGGANAGGVIFSYNTSTSTFTTLYSFTGGNDGSYPQGSLVLSSGMLYGTATAGGANGGGTIFSYNISTSTLTTLYSFADAGDGGNSNGSLILSGSTLYGSADYGGPTGEGTIFEFGL